MKLTELPLAGAFLIEWEPAPDIRGFFSRTFCYDELNRHEILFSCVQCNLSHNVRNNTLRGMHYQEKPHEEAKIVTCIHGRALNVIIDIRENSPTFYKWHGIELGRSLHRSLYVPKGFAHGFLTLEDDTDLWYMMSEFYNPEAARRIHWQDTKIGITWPVDEKHLVLSDRDSLP